MSCVRESVVYHPRSKPRESWSFTNDDGEQVFTSRDDLFYLLRAWLKPAEASRVMDAARFKAFGVTPPPREPDPAPEPTPAGDYLGTFLAENAHHVDGVAIPFAEFYTRFRAWLPHDEQKRWSRIRVSRALPERHPSGAGTGNIKYVGNLSWEPAPHKRPYIIKNGKLRRA